MVPSCMAAWRHFLTDAAVVPMIFATSFASIPEATSVSARHL